MYIPRLAETAVREALKTFPVVVITGARQAGKTTLLKKKFMKGRTFASLDALDIRRLASDDPRAFLNRMSPPTIIDEIQNVPDLIPYIKERVDRERIPGRYILTGSRHFPLMEGISESLAGRAAILQLFPLSVREIRRKPLPGPLTVSSYLRRACRFEVTEDTEEPGEALLRGGFPELHATPALSTTLFFSSYLQTYLDRDVRGNIRNGNLHDFETFLKLLAARTGQVLNYSALAGDIGITVPTVKSWVALLEAASVVFLLLPYRRNFGKRIIKSPKIYFIDTGLAAFLTGLQTPLHLVSGPMAGPLFETFVVSEVMKRFRTMQKAVNLYFWRSTDGHEVDLLIEAEGELTPVEIKLTSTLKPAHEKGLKKWREIAGMEDRRAYLVSSSPITGNLGRGIHNIHWAGL